MKTGIGNNAFRPVFLPLSFGLLTVKILSKITSSLHKCDGTALGHASLLMPLIVTITVYSIFLLLALRWARILRMPASFVFLILPFLFYFIALSNQLLLDLPVTFVVWTAIIILMAITWFLDKSKNTPSEHTDGWGYALIAVFMAQGCLLFFAQNIRMDRVPFADENTFWYTAATAILNKGFLSAHQGSYPGGGLHPLGVPFLSALPGILFNGHWPKIPFFMPIYVLIGFTLVLWEICQRQSRWALFFLILVWFASLNNKSWAGSLFYSMIYGESVSMVMVLSLLGWFSAGKKDSFSLVSAFLIGLLTLTKFPLVLFSVVFFAVFLGQAGKNLKYSLSMIIVFSLPFFVLRAFQMKYGGAIGGLGVGVPAFFHRLAQPHMNMLRGVVTNIGTDAAVLWYYFLVAALLSLFDFKQWRYAWPLVIWVVFLGIYYLYVYAYGTNGGDAASGLRYFLPVAAGTFYVGSHGFARLMDRKDTPGLLVGICLAVLFYKVF